MTQATDKAASATLVWRKRRGTTMGHVVRQGVPMPALCDVRMPILNLAEVTEDDQRCRRCTERKRDLEEGRPHARRHPRP